MDSKTSAAQRPHMNGMELPKHLVIDVPGEISYERSIKRRLYRAAQRGDWKTGKKILRKEPSLLNGRITDAKRETALHIAAGANKVDFVRMLLQEGVNPNELDVNGYTAFCTASVAGALDIVKILLSVNPQFPTTRTASKMTPIYMAAAFGHGIIASEIYEDSRAHLSQDEIKQLFFTSIRNDLFDLAFRMLDDYRSFQLECARDDESDEETALHMLARKPSVLSSQNQGLWNQFINFCPLLRISSHASAYTQAWNVLNKILSRISERNWDTIREIVKQPYHLLFDAAEQGNYNFIVMLLRWFPDLIWERNKQKHTIFHIAILNRHVNIFKLIYETGLLKDLIQQMEDKNGDNILYLTAKLPHPDILNSTVSGEALQMQRELLWYKVIEKFVPPLERNKKNKERNKKNKERNKKNTPKDVFAKTHRHLMKRGETWMKGNAKSCSVVAALIVTVIFATAFAAPGNNSGNIDPKKTTCLILFVSNVIGMCFSSIALMLFLSILISRYAEEDFLWSLPCKFLAGLTSLSISMAAMMMSFCMASHIVFYQTGPTWIPFLVISLTLVPVASFVFLVYPLLGAIFQSTFFTQFNFKPNKSVLHYEDEI